MEQKNKDHQRLLLRYESKLLTCLEVEIHELMRQRQQMVGSAFLKQICQWNPAFPRDVLQI